MAQRTPETTQLCMVSRMVKTPYAITCKLIDSLPKVQLPDIIIYNHKGEIKDTLRNLQGVSLTAVLAGVNYTYEKTRERKITF